jgi:hypothetical protein
MVERSRLWSSIRQGKVGFIWILFRELLFILARLQVNVAKIQQTIPELKRDGSNVLGSLWSTTIYGDSNTSSANSVLNQMNFLQTLAQELQTDPEKTIATFEEIRKCRESSLP